MRRGENLGVGLHDAEPRLTCSIFGIDDAIVAAAVTAAAGGASAIAKGANSGGSGPPVTPYNPDANAFRPGGSTPQELNAAKAAADLEEYKKTHPPAFRAPWDGPAPPDPQLEALKKAADDAKWAADRAPTMANFDEARMLRGADAAQGRAGVQANMAQYDQSRALAMAGRGATDDALGMYRDAAMGKGPSAAQAMLQMGLDRNNAAASSMAASARGGGGNLALAGRGAMMQQAQNNMQGQQQAAMLRAQEQQAGMAGFANLGTQRRAQDLQAMGMDADTAFRQAQIEADQRRQNDTVSLGYEGLRQGSLGRGLEAGTARERIRAASWDTANQVNAGKASGDAARGQAATSSAIDAGGRALAAAGQAYDGASNDPNNPNKKVGF